MKKQSSESRIVRFSEKKAKTITVIGAFIFLLLAVLAVLIYYNAGNSYEVTTYSMGSYVQQTVYGGGKEEAAQNAAASIAALEDRISWRVEGSDVQNLNQNAGGDFITVNPVTYRLLELSAQVSVKSAGAFDITIAPLSWLWDFDSEKQLVPEQALIAELAENINYENILLGENDTVAFKNSSTAADLGAVGKGAACDAAVAVYEEETVSGAVVAVGGSVGVYGKKFMGEPWRIALRNPYEMASVGEISIEEGFLSTSGSYEKSFEAGGTIYHHILDPETGYPAESDLISVTVWCSSGALSDALSTACFVLGYSDSLPVLEAFSAEAIFITKDNGVIVTEGLQDKFTLADGTFHLENSYEG